MAHIEEFSIEKLAGKGEPYARRLNRDVNIFFGTNGSGKTSLLKILHSALEGDAAILEHVPFSKADVKIFSVSYNRVFTRTISHTPPEKASPEVAPSEVSGELYALYKSLPAGGGMEWRTSPKEPEFTSLAHRYLPISQLYMRSAPQERSAWQNVVGLSPMQKKRHHRGELRPRFRRFTQTALGSVLGGDFEGSQRGAAKGPGKHSSRGSLK